MATEEHGILAEDAHTQQGEIDAEMRASRAELECDELRGEQRSVVRLDDREMLLDDRERRADLRELDLGDREHEANERDHDADDRDRAADQREINEAQRW